jgi:subtilisin family serine protease
MQDDEFADFSNYGSCVDIVAPGDKIKSAWIGNSDSTKTLSGTSMSSPLTAGVAATYLSVNPGASPGQVAEALSCSATNDALTQIPSRDTPNRLLYSPPQGWAAVGQCATGSTGTSSAFSHFLGDHVATISSGTLLSSLLLTALW